MNTVPLGSASQINPKKPRDLDPDTLCSFVPMEYVDDHFGTITEAATRRVKQVEKGYTYFHNGDVLFAKITPCMENGKCAIARNLVNGIGFGSTEFHVVRPKHDVMPEWVFYFLRQHSTRQEAARHMTGTAGQQRVPTRFLQEVIIPLPPLPEQKRIAAILAKADRLRRLRRTARDLSDTYLQSVFLEMFGDPATTMGTPLSLDYPVVRLGQVLHGVQSGFACGNRDPDGVIQVRMNNVSTLGRLDLTDSLRVPASQNQIDKYCLYPGDVLFNSTNSPELVGKSALFAGHAEHVVFSNHFIRLRVDEARLDPWYLAHWLTYQWRRRVFRTLCTQWVNQAAVRKDDLLAMKFPLPPLPLQQQFARIVRKFERLRAQQREAERQAEHLFQTLLHQAFRRP